MELGSTRPPDSPDSTSGRIDQVIETAEQAAAEIRSAAEDQAQRELDAVRRQTDTMTRERVAMVSELTEALLDHATVIATQCESLVVALERTMRGLGSPAAYDSGQAEAHALGEMAEPPAPAPPARAAAWMPSDPAPSGEARDVPETFTATAPSPSDDPEPAAATPPWTTGSVPDDDAYLQATRLALGGSSRSEIAEELRRDFGIDDPDPILDRVLGIGSE